MSYRNQHSFSQQQKNTSKSHSFTPLQQPQFQNPHESYDDAQNSIGISPLPIPQDYNDKMKMKDIELEELENMESMDSPRKSKKRGKSLRQDGSESGNETKGKRSNSQRMGQSICDAIVTTSLNLVAMILFVGALAAPSLLLMLVGYNFYYFLIFGALIVPCLLSMVTTYYACVVWIRGARTCKCCLIMNGFVAFGMVCAAISFILAIGGTFGLIEYWK